MKGEPMKPKKKQWIGWVLFEKDKPCITLDQFGNALIEVFKKGKGVYRYGFADIRKVKIEEV